MKGIKKFTVQFCMKLKTLIEPGINLSGQEKRRVSLLAWIQAALLLLLSSTLILVLAVDKDSRLLFYAFLVGALFIVLLAAWILNKNSNYKLSAFLTVFCIIIAPWICIVFDPVILNGDVIPIMYISLSILTCSVLLLPYITFLIALLQCIGLFILLLVTPLSSKINWPSMVAFIFFLSLLSILSNLLSRRDLRQIDNQRMLLLKSEAYLRELSVRDPLTTLFNRRYLDETLLRELRRAERKQYSVGLIIADIDYFKKINDTYGHMTGDALLQYVGELLRSSVREADFACRLGGDEFIMVVPEVTVEKLLERAEQLLKSFNKKPMYIEEYTLYMTFSMGVAAYPEHGTTINDLLNAADKALYTAKKEGRSRIVLAEKGK